MNIFRRPGMLKSLQRFSFLNTRFQLPKTITLCVKYVTIICIVCFLFNLVALNNYYCPILLFYLLFLKESFTFGFKTICSSQKMEYFSLKYCFPFVSRRCVFFFLSERRTESTFLPFKNESFKNESMTN